MRLTKDTTLQIEIPGSSESDVEDWKAKAEQYKARVTYLQQKVQEKKIEQYANTARLAQEGMQLAAKGQEAVKSAGGPTPLVSALQSDSRTRTDFLLVK